MAAVDPVQRHFIEALERRTAAQQGETRRLLEQRLALLRAEASHENGLAHEGAAGEASPATAPLRSLVQRLEGADAKPTSAAAPELKTVRHFRHSWLQLSADRRLAESLAEAPANAGPLNSERLVQRALLLMRELSPAYLHRFLQHAEGLRWLEAARPRDGTSR